MRNLLLILSRLPPLLMLLIILGLSFAATAVFMKQSGEKDARIAQITTAHNSAANAKKVVNIAAKDIPEHTQFTTDCIEQKEVLESTVPIGAAIGASSIIGSWSAYPIQQGQVILSNALMTGKSESQGAVESEIRKGYRAVTIAIDSNSGVAGFVFPGSHVDIFCITGTDGVTKAIPILSDVEVIAAGTNFQKPSGESQAMKSDSITVQVTSDDAAKLVTAIATGKPYLTLRNNRDHAPIMMRGVH